MVLVVCLVGASAGFAQTSCCDHNDCSHDTLHGAYTHQDALSAKASCHGAGHCRVHGCAQTAGTSTHADKACVHDMPHNSYCAHNCSAHHATERAACSVDHTKDCGNDMGYKTCQTHQCAWNCDSHQEKKCSKCGHVHCGLHAWACHTSHHHVVSTHACNHPGCDQHCHVDGLRTELRSKVEEVRLHAKLRG
jgi:hypothetical protein